jgi:4-hydroxybenzoate polyprenyltransferase
MIREIIQQLRPHHWVKNTLVVLPLFLAHKWDNLSLVTDALVAATAFSLLASAVYILNDLRDVHADQAHPSKKHRPIASGRLPRALAGGMAPFLIAGSMVLAQTLPAEFRIWLLAYAALSTVYTLFLKRLVLIDVFTLALLYIIRLLAGGEATNTPVSPWLMMMGLFLFTSIAFVKRYTELVDIAKRNEHGSVGRGYRVHDADTIRMLGIGCGLMAAVVLALYITSPDVAELYRFPKFLWLAVPIVVYWISMMWINASRGSVDDDPIVTMITNPASWIVGALLATIVVVAT